MMATASASSGTVIACGCSPGTATTGRADTPGSSNARTIRQKRFVLDGEAVILGVDGIADFDKLHSRQHDEEVQLCAFDILVEGGDDLRKFPLHLCKTSLQRLLARRPERIFVNPFERGEIGPELSSPPASRIKPEGPSIGSKSRTGRIG
jgi:hypothetical protein